jgi:tetratricopeptide (TPR) repeat protein
MSTITWLHLSDLHAYQARHWDADSILNPLLDDLQYLEQKYDLKPDVLFFTGDAAFGQDGSEAGRRIADQFDEAEAFFENVRNAFKQPILKENTFLVPGNHDIVRPSSLAQIEYLRGPRKLEEMLGHIHKNDSDWRQFMERLHEYRNFLERHHYTHLLDDPARLIYTANRSINGHQLGIVGFNSSWSCVGSGESGRLWLAGEWQMQTLRKIKDADVKVGLIHHHTSWFVPQERSLFSKKLQHNFQFHLHGHDHDGWVEAIANRHVRIAAMACYDRVSDVNGYNIVRLDMDTGQAEIWLRKFDRDGGGWVPLCLYKLTDEDIPGKMTVVFRPPKNAVNPSPTPESNSTPHLGTEPSGDASMENRAVGGFPENTMSLNFEAMEFVSPSSKLLSKAPVSDVKEKPINIRDKPYIIHHYTLLMDTLGEETGLVGRQNELNSLNVWATDPNAQRVMVIEGIGGEGKSALAWTWLHRYASEAIPNLAGRFWWSFYTEEAAEQKYRDFLTHALAYVGGRSQEEVEAMPDLERETALLKHLESRPYLIVLDGLERLLTAYHRTDSAQMDRADQQIRLEDHITGLPLAKGTTEYYRQHYLRSAIAPQIDDFLRHLTRNGLSRILVSSRTMPASFETNTGIIRLCATISLRGLEIDDAVKLWKRMNLKGSKDVLVRLFKRFDCHALLINVIGGLVTRAEWAGRNFDVWQAANFNFNPYDLDISQAKTHILDFALRGLSAETRYVLNILAACYGPVSFDHLASLMAGSAIVTGNERLGEILVELSDRKLIGRDLENRSYDMHPVVRGETWGKLPWAEKQSLLHEIHQRLVSKGGNNTVVTCWEDLHNSVQIFYALIQMEHYDEAGAIFYKDIDTATRYNLGVCFEREKMLQSLFSPIESIHLLRGIENRARALRALGETQVLMGRYSDGSATLSQAIIAAEMSGDFAENLHCRFDRNICYFDLGKLRNAEFHTLKALELARAKQAIVDEADSLKLLSLIYHARGLAEEAERTANLAMQIYQKVANNLRAIETQTALHLRSGRFKDAYETACEALDICKQESLEYGAVSTMAMIGRASLGASDYSSAAKWFHASMKRARLGTFVSVEINARIGLAKVFTYMGIFDQAQLALDFVWGPLQSGGSVIDLTDALLARAELERARGDVKAALLTSQSAYRMAWCDGRANDGSLSYAYELGLQEAEAFIRSLS